MKILKNVLLATGFVITSGLAPAQVIRATDLSGGVLNSIVRGQMKEAVVEFRSGDVLPVQLVAKGDLMETTASVANTITIKKTFWIRPAKNSLEISFDNVKFVAIGEALDGTLKAESGADENGGTAKFINIIFDASLK